jgi:hypothetical protein
VDAIITDVPAGLPCGPIGAIAGTLAVAFLSLILLEEKPLEATHPGTRR